MFEPSNSFNTDNKELSYLDVILDMVDSISKTLYFPHFIYIGGFVLTTILLDNSLDFRITRDLDVDINDKKIMEAFIKDAESLLNRNSKLGLKYTKTNESQHGEDAKGIAFKVNKDDFEISVSMDLAVSVTGTYKDYLFKDVEFRGSSVYTIISDKLHAVCSSRVKRRTKYIYDLYSLSLCKSFTLSKIYYCFKERGLKLDELDGIRNPENYKDIKHAYSKFKGLINKPEFDLLLSQTLSFITPILSYIESGGKNTDKIWDGDWNDCTK